MNYEVEYRGGQPAGLRFEPDPTDSSGTYNHKLLGAAMERFCPKGWSWDGKYLNTKVSNDIDSPTLVEQTQAEVTDLMDKLDEFRDFLYVLKKYQGG